MDSTDSAEFEEVIKFWAYARDHNCQRKFGKTVEELFGFGRGAKTLEEECRLILQDALDSNGEIWYCRDKDGVIRCAYVFEKRPETGVVTFFRGVGDHSYQEARYGTGAGPSPYSQILLHTILNDLVSRGFKILETEHRREDRHWVTGLIAGIRDVKMSAAIVGKTPTYFDTFIKKEMYRVQVDISRLLEIRSRSETMQEMLRLSEAM